MNERIDGFIFYASYYDGISELPEEEQGKLYVALMNYAFSGKDPELTGALSMAFKFIKPTLDANIKRRMAGKLGGHPAAKNEAKERTEEKQKETSAKPKPNQELTSDEPKPNQELTSDEPTPEPKDKDKIKINIKDKDNKKDKRYIAKSSGKTEDEIRAQDVLDLFNAICGSLPRATKVTDERRKAIKARLKDNEPSKFREIFEKVEASDFLTGRDGKWFSCNFDWIVGSPAHWQRIDEGVYDNHEQQGAVDKLRGKLNVSDEERAKAARLG